MLSEREFKQRIGKPFPPLHSMGPNWADAQTRAYLEATGRDSLPEYKVEPFLSPQDAGKVMMALGKKKLSLPETVPMGRYSRQKAQPKGWQ
jgi:hypothetical protein